MHRYVGRWVSCSVWCSVWCSVCAVYVCSPAQPQDTQCKHKWVVPERDWVCYTIVQTFNLGLLSRRHACHTLLHEATHLYEPCPTWSFCRGLFMCLPRSPWRMTPSYVWHAMCTCIAWRSVAVCCSVLQCVAVCCSVLQCVAVCCSVLQCVVSHDVFVRITRGLQTTGTPYKNWWKTISVGSICATICLPVICCTVLQCVAVFGSALQRVAMCCRCVADVLQVCCSLYRSVYPIYVCQSTTYHIACLCCPKKLNSVRWISLCNKVSTGEIRIHFMQNTE